MIEPLEIPLERSVAVALLVCSSGDELNNTALEVVEVAAAAELLLVAFDEELAEEVVDELADVPEAVEELAEPDVGVVG